MDFEPKWEPVKYGKDRGWTDACALAVGGVEVVVYQKPYGDSRRKRWHVACDAIGLCDLLVAPENSFSGESVPASPALLKLALMRVVWVLESKRVFAQYYIRETKRTERELKGASGLTEKQIAEFEELRNREAVDTLSRFCVDKHTVGEQYEAEQRAREIQRQIEAREREGTRKRQQRHRARLAVVQDGGK